MEIGDLYEAITDDSAYDELPAMIARLTGGRAGVIQQFSKPGIMVDFHYSYFSESFIADWARYHPTGRDVWSEAGLRSGIFNRAEIIDKLVPLHSFQKSILWNEVIRPNGDDTGHGIGIMHKFDGGMLCISVQRSIKSGSFTNRDVANLSKIATDLHRIYRTRHLLAGLDSKIDRLNILLETNRTNSMLVGHNMKLIEASPGIKSILDRKDGMQLRAGCIVCHDPVVSQSLRQAVDRSIHRSGLDHAVFLCSRPSGSPPWRLTVLPAVGVQDSGCIVIVSGGELSTDRMNLWLKYHFKATDAEISIANLLAKGLSPKEICRARKVSITTVRTQIRSLLELTNSSNLSNLIRFLTEIC